MKPYTEAQLLQEARDAVRVNFTAKWREQGRMTYSEEGRLLSLISNAAKNLKRKLRKTR